MKLFQFAVLPFLFTHWIGPALLTGYLGFLVILLSLRKNLITKTVKINQISFIAFLIIIIFSLFNLSNIFNGIKLNLVFQGLYLYLNIFLMFILFYFLEPWNLKKLQIISKIIFYIAFFSIFVEFIAVNFFNISNEIIPSYKDIMSYKLPAAGGFYRPFGLTGQSSVNGGILLFSFLLLNELGLLKFRFYILFILGSVCTVSGQAYLCAIFTLMILLLSNIKLFAVRWSFAFLFFIFFFYLLDLNLFQKISFDYLIYVLIQKANIGITLSHLNIWQIAFGTLGVENIPLHDGLSEVYLISSIRLNGVIFTIFLWSFIYFIIRKTRHKYIIFSSIFLSSLHYPSIIYFEAQIPLMLLYTHSNLKKSVIKKTIYKKPAN